MSTVKGKPLPHIPARLLKFVKGDPVDLPVPGAATCVEIFATWCPACRASKADVVQLAQNYGSKGVVFIALSTDTDEAALEHYVQSELANANIRVAWSQEAAKELMTFSGAVGIPHMIVTNANGIVQYTGHPKEPEVPSILSTVVKQMPAGQKAGGPAGAGAGAEAGKTAVPPVTQTRDELMTLPVHDLLDMLLARNIPHVGLAEKPDLVDLIVANASEVVYV